jgi:hypothetical protein
MRKTVFQCDKCLGEILRPEEGQIEWLVRRVGDEQVGRGLRMVHVQTHSPQALDDWGCQYDCEQEYRRDGSGIFGNAITEFLGPAGLSKLLGMLESGVLPQEDVVRMIRRLHTDDPVRT